MNFEEMDKMIFLHIKKYFDIDNLSEDIFNLLVKDIVKNINNIEYRMRWGVYNKINLSKYDNIEKVIRHENSKINFNDGFTRYFFNNIIDYPFRKKYGFLNDLVDCKIEINPDCVIYKLRIFKLKKKNGTSRKENDDFFCFGDKSDYYWDDLEINYKVV